MPHTGLVCVNGRFLPLGDLSTHESAHESTHRATVSVFDRGFLYGDSLYEVIKVYDGKPFAFSEHIARMQGSALLARMNFKADFWQDLSEQIFSSIAEFSKHFKNQDAYCRIIVTRGAGKIGFAERFIETSPSIVIYMIPVGEFYPGDFEKGSHLKITKRIRNSSRALDPAMKSGNYLNSVLAYLEATQEDGDDAILCDGDGFVTEGSTFNVFYARKGILVTSPLRVGILEGITRRYVLQIAKLEGIETREVDFLPEKLKAADEVFTTGTIKEIFPVTRIDHKKIGNGMPGPMTRLLAEKFQECVSV